MGVISILLSVTIILGLDGGSWVAWGLWAVAEYAGRRLQVLLRARVYKQGLRQVVPATLKLNHVTNKSCDLLAMFYEFLRGSGSSALSRCPVLTYINSSRGWYV